ncbi:OmpH family outer membrane protein [Aureispira anguillae]|uniref:OmpH family outer membrane protein n=1 Tax=Aureispira anguillae TaxID=2864201 RepID=A0A915YG72_9BACT|nr:OmpH family outer membrane protein [Aureispira anguillae]BDS12575.1 OmpH family outer membrane protein [Aureispira anguillae]
MKNIQKLLVLVVMLLVVSWSQNSYAQQIAYIEAEAIVPEMAAYKRAKSEVEAYGKQLQKVLEQKQADMEAYYKEVMDSIKRGLMTPKQQQEAEAKLQRMQADLQKDAMDAEKKLAQKESELTKPIYEAFNQAISKVAKENNYTYVLDKKFMLYSAGGIDATEKVKTALGISW